MNPLTVLKGGTLMRPLSDLKRDPADPSMIQLDRAGRCLVRLDAAGRPVDLKVAGAPGKFIPYGTELDLSRIAGNIMVTGNARTPMRAAVMVRQITLRPLVLLGAEGELVGVVGEQELYRGMLKQTDLGRSDPIAMVGVT